jgi:tol-pal system protein YbgF
MGRGRIALLAWLAALGAAAGGCAVADTGAFVRVQDDMDALKREMAALKADRGAAFPQAAGDVAPLRRSLADLASDTDRIKADLLALSARTDDAKLQMQREVSRLNDATAELAQAVTELRRKDAEAERRVAALEERAGRLPAERTTPGAPPEPSVQDLSTPEELYDYALGLVKRGEHRKGREVLNAFAGKYPDHRLMQNVYYWKGETFYGEKDYESAILSFQDVVDRHPGGDKAPDAMLKQGLAFQALNDPKNARILYELVRSKYPRSAAAEKARERLLELK